MDGHGQSEKYPPCCTVRRCGRLRGVRLTRVHGNPGTRSTVDAANLFTMRPDADIILTHLRNVADERAKRDAEPALALKVRALKIYQQRRFSKTYADILESERYGRAARFFLEELYGPRDFADRDTQFARVVPALVRLFPRETVVTVSTLAELHALSEALDTATASHLLSEEVGPVDYARAWQATGRAADRARQIALTLSIGESLDELTRNSLLRHTLRMMRAPARAAGLAELQEFLETGFDAFKAIKGARTFLDTINARERLLARVLFEAPLDGSGHLGDTALGQLP